YLDKYRGQLIIAYLALFIGLAAILAVPQLVRYVIDHGIGDDNRSVVLLGSFAIVGASVATGVFTYMRSYLFQSLSERVATDMRAEYFRKLQTLPFSFYDRSQTGQLMSRGSEDITSIRRFMMFSLRMLVYGTAMML